MCGYHRRAIDDRVTGCLCKIRLARVNPVGIETKRGLFRWNTFELSAYIAWVDSEFVAHSNGAAAAHGAFDNNVVSHWVYVEIVADTNRLNKKTQFSREFFANAAYARK